MDLILTHPIFCVYAKPMIHCPPKKVLYESLTDHHDSDKKGQPTRNGFSEWAVRLVKVCVQGVLSFGVKVSETTVVEVLESL